MSKYIEASPELISPEYWDGLDIKDESKIQGRRSPVLLTAKEQLKASIDLAHRLEETMLGLSAESEINLDDRGIFDPEAWEMTDGAVLILDTEGLTRYIPASEVALKAPEKTSEPEEPTDFLDLWKRNQPGSPNNEFGQELAVFPDEGIIYTRALKWGVVLSRHIGEERHRLMSTWQFSVPRTHAGGVRVMPEEADPGSKTFPTQVGIAAEQPNFGGHNIDVRNIERINSISLVQ